MITFCLTNWKRPDSLQRTIASLKQQTIKTQLYLWNNGDTFRHPDIDWNVTSSVNRLCWPRWYMATYASTEYVASIDDDVILTDERLLEMAIERLSQRPMSTIVGPEGVNLIDGCTYRESQHFKVSSPGRLNDEPCDIIKGKFMLLRTSALQGLPFGSPDEYREDDIAVSGMLAEGRRKQHLCLTSLNHCFRMMDEPHALYKLDGHFARRESASVKYFRHC